MDTFSQSKKIQNQTRGDDMLVKPKAGTIYGMKQLEEWFAESQKRGEKLVISPCNPKDTLMIQTKATIRCWDDMAILTQWLGGLNENNSLFFEYEVEYGR